MKKFKNTNHLFSKIFCLVLGLILFFPSFANAYSYGYYGGYYGYGYPYYSYSYYSPYYYSSYNGYYGSYYGYYGGYYCQVCPSCCPPPSPLNVSCYASPNPAQANQRVTFHASASGATGYLRRYSYSWSGACAGSSKNCRSSFSQPGFYTATVIATTSSGQIGTATCSVEVRPPLCRCYRWRNWRNQGCGQNGCGPNQMYQIRTRTCRPQGCDLEMESRCVENASCCQPVNDPPSGTLLVSPTTVYVGETITITVDGEDADGLSSLRAYYKGRWHRQSVSRAVTASRTWNLTEQSPGIYRYCGKVTGYRGHSWYQGLDTVYTSPACVDVEVICPPCPGESQSNNRCGCP